MRQLFGSSTITSAVRVTPSCSPTSWFESNSTGMFSFQASVSRITAARPSDGVESSIRTSTPLGE